MANLQQQVEESAKLLREALEGLSKVRDSTSLPAKCRELWMRRAALHEVLTGTVAIFVARETAWKAVNGVAKSEPIVPSDNQGIDPTNDVSRNLVNYGSILMEFGVARHLALVSYASVAWSIYDRLTNVCGRLAGIADIADNPKQNPKACEDLLGRKDVLGFASHFHVREAYSWPLKVSYKVRNWLVHEGYEEGGTTLFRGNRVSDQFFLHRDAIEQLQNSCGYTIDDGKIALSCIGKDRECWKRGDLLEILELYHSELDTMFSAMLKWSVESFAGQIRAFARHMP